MRERQQLSRLIRLGCLERPRRDRPVALAEEQQSVPLLVVDELEHLEPPAPMRPYPPGRQQYVRAAVIPGGPYVEYVHPDPVLLPWLAGDRLGHAAAKERRDQQPVWLQQTVQLGQPRAPLGREVGEHGHREHQIERRLLERKWRRRRVHEGVNRRRQVRAQPIDAGLVDVTPVERRRARLVQQVPQQLPGSAAEVQYALAGERPLG